jgi:hypothetical protein
MVTINYLMMIVIAVFVVAMVGFKFAMVFPTYVLTLNLKLV